MAKPGPKPMPAERARRLGNPGKRPLAAVGPEVHLLDLVESAVAPPRPLGEAGMVLWRRCWSSGARWIAATDLELVAMLCESVDEREVLRAVVLADGLRFDRAALRALDRQIVATLSLLGFSPSDRASMGVAEVRAATDLAKLIGQRTGTA